MIYRYKYKDFKGLKSHTKIWACDFQLDRSKTQMGLFQKPIYGEIRGKINPHTNEESESGYYFIPYKKNSTELAMSKKVRLEARCYADTYEECRDLYNTLIDERINWFKEKISEMEMKKI